jgi:thioredoxin 1
MKDLIVQLDAKSFDAALKEKIVLVEFWEPWCGPCQIELPVLEEVARHFGRRVTVAKVNVDEAQKLAAQFGIACLPTLVLFKHGKVVHKFAGYHSGVALIEALEDAAK